MAHLYQFAGSHYCEKARWALDYKGIAYRAINLLPGPHVKQTRRIAPQTALPIFVDGARVIQGSVEIIDYLDKTTPRPPLTPLQSADASMARELERYLDNNIGLNIRLLFYYHAFQDRAFVTDFLVRGTPWWGRPFVFCAYPGLKRAMKRALRIDEERATTARAALQFAFDRMDERIGARKFLAGPHFSRADLTASALLFHCWDPQWQLPAGLDNFLARLRDRPFYRWAAQIYAQHRHPVGGMS